MRKLSFLLILSPLFAFADIDGNYTVSGYDPLDEKNYAGTAQITKDKDDIYQAAWKIGSRRYTGTGIRSGNYISFVSSGAVLEGEQPEIALNVYEIKDDNTLQGPWVRLYSDLVGNETLKKQ